MLQNFMKYSMRVMSVESQNCAQALPGGRASLPLLSSLAAKQRSWLLGAGRVPAGKMK